MTSRAVEFVRAHFRKGMIIGEKMELGDELGIGSYGVVFQGQRPDGTKFAVKILSKNNATPYAMTAIQREMNLLININHRNIIRASRVEETRQFATIEMECADGSVCDLLEQANEVSLHEKLVLVIFRGLLDAILHLHGIGIAHCDIKHENTLYKHDAEGLRIILCDFGMSVNVKKDVVWPVLGTPAYKSPELVDGRQLDYNPFAADIWALSITLFVLLTWDTPWREARETDAAYSRYVADPRSFFKLTPSLCQPVEDLLLRGLNLDPKLRPDIHTYHAAFAKINELWEVNKSPKRSLTPDVGETDVAKRSRTSGGDECACCGEASLKGLIYPFKGQWENHWVCERCLQSGKETSLIGITRASALGLRKGDIYHLRQLVIEKGCDASVPAFLIKGPRVVVSTSDVKSIIPVLYHELRDGKPTKTALQERTILHRAYMSQLRGTLYVRLSAGKMKGVSPKEINNSLIRLFRKTADWSQAHTLLANGLTLGMPMEDDEDKICKILSIL